MTFLAIHFICYLPITMDESHGLSALTALTAWLSRGAMFSIEDRFFVFIYMYGRIIILDMP